MSKLSSRTAAVVGDLIDTAILWLDNATSTSSWKLTWLVLRTKLETYFLLKSSEIFTGDIPVADNTDYVLWTKAPFAGTINTVGAVSASGTCTLTPKIGSTALGGSANSVSSTYAEQAHSTSNHFNKGDTVKATVSSNSSCLGLEYAFFITRD